MKQPKTFAGLFLAVALCLASCGNNNQAKQNSELKTEDAELQERIKQLEDENAKLKQNATPAVKTFTTNKGTFNYDEALNYCYTIGYKDGSSARVNSSPQYIRERDMEGFESTWTCLYGVPTSTEEAREAYKACFEKYKQGHNEAFNK